MSSDSGFRADCDAVVRALWDYLDRALGEADMAAIEAHLAACDDCHGHAAFERHLLNEIHTLRVHGADPDALRARVLDLLRRARPAGPER